MRENERECERMWVIAPVVQQQQQSFRRETLKVMLHAERGGGGTKHDAQIQKENGETGNLFFMLADFSRGHGTVSGLKSPLFLYYPPHFFILSLDGRVFPRYAE